MLFLPDALRWAGDEMRNLNAGEILLIAMLIGGSSAFLIGHAGIRFGTPFFGSQTGVFDAVISVLTLIALIAGGIGAFVSYKTAIDSLDASRTKDQWEQFRAGVQMLAAQSDAEAIAGIEIITELAETQPKPFEQIGFHVLRSYINELSADAKACVWDRSSPTTLQSVNAPWPRQDAAETIAFIALGVLAAARQTRGDENKAFVEGRSLISNVLVVDHVIFSATYHGLYIDRIALADATFRDCDFRLAKLVGIVRSALFEGCDLTNAVIDLEMLAFTGSPPKFVNCKIAGCSFNGQPLEKWIADNS